jgi:hypothetical protein
MLGAFALGPIADRSATETPGRPTLPLCQLGGFAIGRGKSGNLIRRDSQVVRPRSAKPISSLGKSRSPSVGYAPKRTKTHDCRPKIGNKSVTDFGVAVCCHLNGNKNIGALQTDRERLLGLHRASCKRSLGGCHKQGRTQISPATRSWRTGASEGLILAATSPGDDYRTWHASNGRTWI